MAEAGLACRPFLRQWMFSMSKEMGQVLRKAIFITGGGSGIGRATAQFFAGKGWFVGLADINAKGLAETAALLRDGQSSQHMFDVRDRDAWVTALADFATKSGGRMDVLFNNAGIAVGGPLIDTLPADIERMLDINLKSLFWGAQVGFPYLKATPGSALINTSSAAGLYAGPGMAGYAAAKFGVRALTDSLDQEWANDGIKVASIMPSFIDTPLLDAHAAGSNRQTRDVVRDAGLEFTPVEAVAQTVWDAVHGTQVHNVIGKTARRVKFMSRWFPGVLRKQGKGRRGVM
jgi:NAD(P)-dependent dehydrogenase (short-subunit alcohol dehydrogenase family)